MMSIDKIVGGWRIEPAGDSWLVYHCNAPAAFREFPSYEHAELCRRRQLRRAAKAAQQALDDLGDAPDKSRWTGTTLTCC